MFAMSEEKHLSGAEGLKKIADLIQDIRIAMLTTVAADGSFDSRPMATQKTEFDGQYGFLRETSLARLGRSRMTRMWH
jgi:general stress protein 26